jgi:hypothetical protein
MDLFENMTLSKELLELIKSTINNDPNIINIDIENYIKDFDLEKIEYNTRKIKQNIKKSNQ